MADPNSVRLRVVGIYFNQRIKIKFDGGGDPVTIETLHNEAMEQFPFNNPNGADGNRSGIFFTGSFEQPGSIVDPEKGNPIRTVSHSYPGKYNFNGNDSLDDKVDGETLGGKIRPKGIYELSEQLIENGLLAWQYYVSRGGKIVSKTPSSRKFTPYQEFILEDQDIVTWRLVSIASRPRRSSRELRLRK